MTRNNQKQNESGISKETTTTDANDDQRNTTTVIETRAPGALGECTVCGQQSATHHLANGESLCGYCLGQRQGRIQQEVDPDSDLTDTPRGEIDPQQFSGLQITPDHVAVRCHHCGNVIRSGTDLVALVSQPTGEPTYAVEYVWCFRDRNKLPTKFNEGVAEFVVEGIHQSPSVNVSDGQRSVLQAEKITKRSLAAHTHETLTPEEKAKEQEILEQFR